MTIILTGFMGTGKTTVGQLVAQQLQREFVDTDELIVTREGRTIAQIFADAGAAYFRERERALCHELAQRDGLVIATGGGMLIDDENRAVLSRRAQLFCLTAQPAELARRLQGDVRRPLLESRDGSQRVEERIAELLLRREAAYALIPHHIATDGLSAAQVAAQIVARVAEGPRVELQRVVHAGSESYQVLMGAGLWRILGTLLRERLPHAARAAIVTDEIVGPLHAETIASSLRAAGFTTSIISMPARESAKTLDTVSQLYDGFIDAQLERSSVVLALGGGLVGDVAGFAAATYLRGVHFVQLPTTVLALVDASLGGKTAVNHARGKNLIGAFKQPALVCGDREALCALPVADLRSGLAEVVKHGIIGAPALFAHLEQHGLSDMPRILAEGIEVKLRVIEADPHERAERAVLNLGHTFGHAFETLSQYRVRHGEAVAMGLAASSQLAARLRMCDAHLPERIAALLARLELPTTFAHYEAQAVLDVMATDKKREQGKIRFVLPVELGKVVVRSDVPAAEVRALFASEPTGARA